MSEPLNDRPEDLLTDAQGFLDILWAGHPGLAGARIMAISYTTIVVSGVTRKWYVYQRDLASAGKRLATRYDLPHVRIKVRN